MSDISLDTAFDLVRSDYCLWVGAGLTSHLCRAAGIRGPGWAELTAELERTCKVSPSPASNYQVRLGTCLDKIGWKDFQQRLREHLLLPACVSVMKLAVEGAKSGAWQPTVAEDIMRLGYSANPIVSFNIESLTSILLAYPDAPSTIAAFSPHVAGAVQPVTTLHYASAGDRRFARVVYHPHGSLDLGGICVMTDRDYDALHDGTLAMQLATHAAFGRNLVVVGMSLEDEYLRQQLTSFRPYVGHIIWFVNPAPRRDLRDWATATRVATVPLSDWGTFWAKVRSALPLPAALGMTHAWSAAVHEARRVLENIGSRALAEHFATLPVPADVEARWRLHQETEYALADAKGEPKVQPFVPCLDDETMGLLIRAEFAALEAHDAFGAK